MTILRMAVDIEVIDGDEVNLVNLVFDARKSITDYIKDVVIPSDDRGEGAKLKSVGGNSHMHEIDPETGKCNSCANYARVEQLAPVEL